MACRDRVSARRRPQRADLPHRVLHQPRLRRGGAASAAPHRPDLPVDRGPVRRQRGRGAPAHLGHRDARGAGRRTGGRGRIGRAADATHLHHLRRRDRPGHRQHAPVVPVPALHDHAQGAGHPVNPTLADCLRTAAHATPDRILIRDGERTLQCAALLEQASALAHALVRRMPVGSVVSFMVPNWWEAAVIYLGATLGGMVVNPILPSLRDHELSFLLADAGSRAVFIPHRF
ncbi:AMP-binding protein, partial [Mycobacterium rufum]|nr:AMP-binding protein [Mycolicibacterium rufum]